MLGTIQHANYCTGETLGFTQDANYSIEGMLETRPHANNSTGEILKFTLEVNYSIRGILVPSIPPVE